MRQLNLSTSSGTNVLSNEVKVTQLAHPSLLSRLILST